MSEFRKAAEAAEKARGGKPSADIDFSQLTKRDNYPHLREGYNNLVGQPIGTVKAMASEATQYVKSKFIDKDNSGSDTILKDWQRWDKARAKRDLGGPRTPPYQGGK